MQKEALEPGENAIWGGVFATILCTGVLATLVVYRSGGYFGDFWDYAGFIKSFESSIFRPGPALVGGEQVLIPYWPFLALVELLRRLGSLDVISALAVMGSLNAALLCFACLHFCEWNLKLSVFWLSAILGLWGVDPWLQSNFLHASVLPFVLPYPATFAFSLSLILLRDFELLVISSRRHSARLFGLLLAGSSVVALSHPIVFLFYLIGIIAWVICAKNTRFAVAEGLALCSIQLALVIWWPYFPLIEGLAGSGHLTSTGSRMYSEVFDKLYPTLLLGSLVMPLALRTARGRRIGLFALGLALVYLIGGLLHLGSFGRVISFIAILLQLLVALAAFRLSNKFKVKVLRFKIDPIACVFLLLTLSGITTLLKTAHGAAYSSCFTVKELLGESGRSSVVLASQSITQCIPTTGALAVSVIPTSCAFVPRTCEDRLVDSARFFSCQTAAATRNLILEKYQVKRVLIDCQSDDCNCLYKEGIESTQKDQSGRFHLIEIGPNREARPSLH